MDVQFGVWAPERRQMNSKACGAFRDSARVGEGHFGYIGFDEH